MAAVQDEDGANMILRRRGRSERYEARKAMYRPGTMLAIELITDPDRNFNAPSGSYGLAMVRDCNWLAHLALFLFEAMFDEIPTLEQAQAVARPELLWYWDAYTGDSLIISGHWVVLGQLDAWDPTEWRELANIDRHRNEVLWLRYGPRRNPVEERTPLTPELEDRLGGLPEWPLSPSGAIVPSITLTLALTDDAAWAHLPFGPERTAALKARRSAALEARRSGER